MQWCPTRSYATAAMTNQYSAGNGPAPGMYINYASDGGSDHYQQQPVSSSVSNHGHVPSYIASFGNGDNNQVSVYIVSSAKNTTQLLCCGYPSGLKRNEKDKICGEIKLSITLDTEAQAIVSHLSSRPLLKCHIMFNMKCVCVCVCMPDSVYI